MPTPRPGTDTATGTDPEAKWEQPGYEDKSLGQAVATLPRPLPIRQLCHEPHHVSLPTHQTLTRRTRN